MTHDPLCPAPLCDWTGESGNDCMGYEDCHHLCQCDLIARVRADERMIRQEEKRVSFMEGQETCALSYNKALRDAVAAVKVLPSAWTDAAYRQKAIAAIEALGGER